MVKKDETFMEAVKPRNIWIEEMGYEVDAQILDAYAQLLIDAPMDEAEKSFSTAKQKKQDVETEFNQKKREKQQGKARKFVEQVSQDIEALIDVVMEKGRKRKEPEIFIKPVAIESGSDDDTTLAFKRVLRKKTEETKVEAKKQPVRKVTIRVPTQKWAPKETPSAPSSTGRRKKMDDIDLALVTGNVTIIPPKTCVELVDEITKDGMLKIVQFYYENLDDDEKREVEEAVLLYLDIYKKTLLDIENQILAQLYDKLDARRLSTMEEDNHIKIEELLTIYASIT